MKSCAICGSHAFNMAMEGVNQGAFCDRHYWQRKAEALEAARATPDTHRVVPVDALNRIMELAGVALVYQPFGTKDRQHFDALMAIIEDKP